MDSMAICIIYIEKHELETDPRFDGTLLLSGSVWAVFCICLERGVGK